MDNVSIVLKGGRYDGQVLEGVRVEGEPRTRLTLLGYIYTYASTKADGQQVWEFQRYEKPMTEDNE